MAQLMLTHDVVNNPILRDYLQENIEELETALPEDTPVTVRIKRISKRVFGADVRARMLGRMLVVSAQGKDVFQALTRARRHLLRQVEDLRRQKRQKARQARRHLHVLTTEAEV